MFLDLPLQYKSHPERKKINWVSIVERCFAFRFCQSQRQKSLHLSANVHNECIPDFKTTFLNSILMFQQTIEKKNKPTTQIKYFKYHTSVRIILLYCGWDAIALVGWEPCMDLTDCQSQVYFSWNEKCIMFVLDFTKIQQTAKLKSIKYGAGPMAWRESRVLAAKAGDVNWICGTFMLERENKLPQTVLGPPHGRHRLHSWVCTHNIYK